MKRITLCLALAACLLISPTARADSIWARRTQRYAFLFDDNRARNVGDVLTVIISENTNIGQREQRNLQRSSVTTGSFDFQGSSSSDNAQRTGALNYEAENNAGRQFTGQANFTSGRTYTDRMAVTVVDILPNGNLVVEGHRIRVVSGERRHLKVTGVVRPADLSPVNTIQSESVANFRIEYIGRGVDTQFTTQGWADRILNFLWPF